LIFFGIPASTYFSRANTRTPGAGRPNEKIPPLLPIEEQLEEQRGTGSALESAINRQIGITLYLVFNYYSDFPARSQWF